MLWGMENRILGLKMHHDNCKTVQIRNKSQKLSFSFEKYAIFSSVFYHSFQDIKKSETLPVGWLTDFENIKGLLSNDTSHKCAQLSLFFKDLDIKFSIFK